VLYRSEDYFFSPSATFELMAVSLSIAPRKSSPYTSTPQGRRLNSMQQTPQMKASIIFPEIQWKHIT
jgi:hypothetical protein